MAEVLKRHGVPVWYSRVNIRGAQQRHDEIGAALRRCDWFAVLLSPHSVRSMWVKRELLFALSRVALKVESFLYYSLRVTWTNCLGHYRFLRQST